MCPIPKNRKKPRRRKAKFVDSSVSRKDVIRVLERLAAGKKCRSFLVLDLQKVAERLWQDMCLTEEEFSFYMEYRILPDDWENQF